MIAPRLCRMFASLFLCVLLLVTACASPPPSRFEQAQQESTQQKSGQAVVKEATQGSEFNQFFPAPSEGYERVYAQEKRGFAQAKLKKGGEVMAVLSIADTKSLPSAAAKYQQATKQIGGYPAVEQGSTATGVLVADRYQVKVQSRNPSFTVSDRETWLQKFDLEGLARLQ